MSKHYEERTYVRGYGGPSDYDEYRVRRRSSSRSSRGRGYYDGRQRALSRSDSGSSISTVSDYEYKGHYVTSERSLVRVPRDVIRAPTPPPVIQRVVERAPTPEPDIVERVIVRPQPQQLIERIIERPRTPPPKIIDKEITEPAPPPIVRTRIVKVDHSGRHYSHGSYPQAAAIPVPVQKVRHVETIPRTSGLSTYGYQDAGYIDYYGGAAAAVPNRSYSQSYSAVELYPSTVYVPQSPGPNVSYNVTTTAAAPLYPSSNYNCYPYTQQSLGGYGGYSGYNSYGYRPAASTLAAASAYPYVSGNAYTNSQYNLYNANPVIGPTF